MQFIKDGPDVPEGLLKAHEDGNVIFFCGAGISGPAGLPGFSGLVEAIYAKLGMHANAPEKTALDAYQYDTVLGLLEGRLADGRNRVRTIVEAILKPDRTLPDMASTHEALLTLARSRKGHTRLVTTNFDRLFEEAVAGLDYSVATFNAPLLPVPKARWDGLVYLHGMFPEKPSASDLNRLVLASGDFGLAYLVERWAARFVSELLRNYTVCFVGYSINDPVMRYMMDALAADRLMGEIPRQAYVFGSYGPKGADIAREEWESKNVIPVLYEATPGHPLLHQTLKEWSATYRDGVEGKEAVVVRYAGISPTGSTKQDDFVGRMIWALSDETGLPAKLFADHDPLPPLSWLAPLSEPVLGNSDLGRFGITTEKVENGNDFSLLKRPSPHNLSVHMSLVGHKREYGGYDNVMHHLARWAARHYGDPQLLSWIAMRSGVLHPRFKHFLERELVNRKGKDGSVSDRMFSLLLAGRVGGAVGNTDLYDWTYRASREGLTMGVRLALREALSPFVQIRQATAFDNFDDEGASSEQVRWDVVLNSQHVHSALSEIRKTEAWADINRDVLADVTGLLKDVLDIKRDLGAASVAHDFSYLHQPSVSDHPQNRQFNDWTILIELVRDGWLALADQGHPAEARAEIQRWLSMGYPIFQRLSFFAATERPDIVAAEEALGWLLSDDARWLWSNETQRETLLLVAALGTRLSPQGLNMLCTAILTAPPESLPHKDVKPAEVLRFTERRRWLLLRRLVDSGSKVTPEADECLRNIESQYPKWRLDADDRDDFPFWMGDGDTLRTYRPTPVALDELVAWLAEHPYGDDFREEDDWSQRCEKDAAVAMAALERLAEQKIWPASRWQQALQVWSREGFSESSWRSIGPVVVAFPMGVLTELSKPVASWMAEVAKALPPTEYLFLPLCTRMLQIHRDLVLPTGEEQGNLSNHPVSFITQAVLSVWFKQDLEDDKGLAEPFREILEVICQPDAQGLEPGRLVLARAVITLYRVDAAWTVEHLLPHFDWDVDARRALVMWESYLRSPRIHWPLFDQIKASLIGIVDHFDELQKVCQRQYAGLMTTAALHASGSFSKEDFQRVFGRLPTDAFFEVATALLQGFRGAGDQRDEFFKNRIVPFIGNYWRKSVDAITPSTSRKLAEICVLSGEAFTDAVYLLKGFLVRVDDPSYVISNLASTDLCSLFPNSALDLFDALIADGARWLTDEFNDCLQAIENADVSLSRDPRYRRLVNIRRMSNFPATR